MDQESKIKTRIVTYIAIILFELYLLYADIIGLSGNQIPIEKKVFGLILIPVVVLTFQAMFKKLNKVNDNNSTDLKDIKNYLNLN
jgi:hypothetical protein